MWVEKLQTAEHENVYTLCEKIRQHTLSDFFVQEKFPRYWAEAEALHEYHLLSYNAIQNALKIQHQQHQPADRRPLRLRRWQKNMQPVFYS